MTDFVQTMKDWRRMCQHMEKIGGDKSCDICPLDGCNAIYEDDGKTDYVEIREKVAAWAAEHPEPVYPTWGEWFVKQSGLAKEWKNTTNPAWEANMAIGMFRAPIPADIAQKLGIEPKEDKPNKRTKDMVCGNDYCELE